MAARANSLLQQGRNFFFGKKKKKTFVSLVLLLGTTAAHAAPPPASAYADLYVPEGGDDTSALEADSPDRHADKIEVPVRLIDGRKDFVVSDRQTGTMDAALKASGKTEQTIYLPEADYTFSHTADRLALLNALGTFLAQSLGGS